VQWHSIQVFFRVTFRNGVGIIGGDDKIIGREKPETDGTEINFMYFSL
jgi:hypothetical protein